MMNTQNIDDQIRQYYTQQELSADALERLRNLVEHKQSREPQSSLRMWQTFALAATVALAFLAGVIFVIQSSTPAAGPTPIAVTDISNQLAREVAMRHNTCEHVEFAEDDFATLAAKMTNLDFDLEIPEVLEASNLKLLGAHYCVVNGQLALHATFIDENGETISLLETKATRQLDELRHANFTVDNTDVEMWRVNDTIMAVARSVA